MSALRVARATLALVLLVAGGCRTGVSAKEFRPVREARGVGVMVGGPTAELKGELLEVREHGLLIWDGCRLLLAPFERIQDSGFIDVDPRWLRGRPTEPEREELRLLSRYPAGVPAAALAELLKCSGAAEPPIADI